MLLALTQIASGRKYICSDIKNILAQNIFEDGNEQPNLNTLSVREVEIIGFIRQGFSSKEISNSLYIAVKTVEVHRYNILRKLHLKNAAALVNYINHFDFAN